MNVCTLTFATTYQAVQGTQCSRQSSAAVSHHTGRLAPALMPSPKVLLNAGADLLRIQVVGGLKARRHRQADAGLAVHALAAGGVLQRGCSKEEEEEG